MVDGNPTETYAFLTQCRWKAVTSLPRGKLGILCHCTRSQRPRNQPAVWESIVLNYKGCVRLQGKD